MLLLTYDRPELSLVASARAHIRVSGVRDELRLDVQPMIIATLFFLKIIISHSVISC